MNGKVNDQGEPFGTWLLAQTDAESAVGEFARVARTIVSSSMAPLPSSSAG